MYTSTVPSNSLLMVDASLNNFGCTLNGITISFNTNQRNTTRRYEYDHIGRLSKTWHKLDVQSEILLTSNAYNELGQLIDKKLHSTK